MKKIEGFRGRAKKISGVGCIVYELWVNFRGDLFVKLIDNELNTSRPGTHSAVFYSVGQFADRRDSTESIGNPVGIDEMGVVQTRSDNNNGAFLKAVLRDLLPAKNGG